MWFVFFYGEFLGSVVLEGLEGEFDDCIDEWFLVFSLVSFVEVLLGLLILMMLVLVVIVDLLCILSLVVLLLVVVIFLSWVCNCKFIF